jgi:hypothetical protein
MRNLPTGSRFPKALTERFDLCCGVSFSQSRQRSTESKGQNSTLASALERVMNSITNGLGMGKMEIAKEPSLPWNPHFYAIFAQVHNTLYSPK